MREIVVKTFYREKSEYVVRLGNGTSFRFKSEKSTKKFLADTNRFLSEVAFQSNQILTELYQHSREIWLVAPDFNLASAQSEIMLLEHFIKQSYSRADWKQGNYYVFIDLKKFCDHSKSLIKKLGNVKRVVQTDTIRRHRLNCLFDQVQALYIRLINYGQSACFEMFDISSIKHIADVVDTTSNLKVA